MKYFLIIIFLILTSCAHNTSKKQEVIVDHKNENLSTEKTSSILKVDFENNLNMDENSISFCDENKILFLIKQPFNYMNLHKDFYDRVVGVNEILQDMISSAISLRSGKMEPSQYLENINELTKEMDELTQDSEEKYLLASRIFLQTSYIYPLCQKELQNIMKSKKVDVNQDNCEYQQTLGYIQDPFEFKKISDNAISVEMKVYANLQELYKIIMDELQGNKNSEDSKNLFLKKLEELQQSGLESLSQELNFRTNEAFISTIEIEDKCSKK